MRPRPVCGNFALDIFFLLTLCIIQGSILPTFLGRYFSIDLITPWLIYTFVFQQYGKSFFLLALASMYLEAHSSIPSGLHFCIYWISLSLIATFKEPISWRHFTPWLTAVALATCCQQFLSYAMELLLLESIKPDWIQLAIILLKCVVSSIIGVYMIVYFINREEKEVEF